MAIKTQQADIIILGLGPGNPDYLTLRASTVIQNSREIYLRTREHPTVDALPPGLKIHSFDSYYQDESFENVYKKIANEIINLAKTSSGIVYAVPGDPFIAEATPAMIKTLAKKENLTVEIL